MRTSRQPQQGPRRSRALQLIAANSGHRSTSPATGGQLRGLLTATAAHARWRNWEPLISNSDDVIAPILDQPTHLAKN